MKKIWITMLVMFSLILTGCGNSFSEEDYDSNTNVAEASDNYIKGVAVFNHMDGEYSFKSSKFKGYETLWSESFDESKEMEITFSFSLSEGKAKVVYIDEEDNITTLIECTPDTCTEKPVTQTVSLRSGKNRLKIVGYGCKDLNLKMQFDEP